LFHGEFGDPEGRLARVARTVFPWKQIVSPPIRPRLGLFFMISLGCHRCFDLFTCLGSLNPINYARINKPGQYAPEIPALLRSQERVSFPGIYQAGYSLYLRSEVPCGSFFLSGVKFKKMDELRRSPDWPREILDRCRPQLFLKKDIWPIRVVMLAGVHKDLCMHLSEFPRDRGTLDEPGAGRRQRWQSSHQ
jgi:hypothetical protein